MEIGEVEETSSLANPGDVLKLRFWLLDSVESSFDLVIDLQTEPYSGTDFSVSILYI